jgi:hypothetical protein
MSSLKVPIDRHAPQDAPGCARSFQTTRTRGLPPYETVPRWGFPVVGFRSPDSSWPASCGPSRLAGIPPLRRDRTNQHPVVLIGGPHVLEPAPGRSVRRRDDRGEADDVALRPLKAAVELSRRLALDVVAAPRPGFVPERTGPSCPDCESIGRHPSGALANPSPREPSIPTCSSGRRAWLPSAITFCVMRRRFRTAGCASPPRTGFSNFGQARRVGLVGGHRRDHGARGTLSASSTAAEGGVSSPRADRVALKPVPRLLLRGRLQTLPVASVRRPAAAPRDRRGTTEKHLVAARRGRHAARVPAPEGAT